MLSKTMVNGAPRPSFVLAPYALPGLRLTDDSVWPTEAFCGTTVMIARLPPRPLGPPVVLGR